MAQVGDRVTARDSPGQWYSARVIGRSGDVVRVHFDGWAERWDEDINLIDGRLMAWSSRAAVGPRGRDGQTAAPPPLVSPDVVGGVPPQNHQIFVASALQVRF
jgi:hypothetical protein